MRARTSWIPPLVGAIVMTVLVAGGDAILANRLLAHAHARAGLRGSDVLWVVAALTPNFVTLSLWLAVPFWRRQARDPRGGARGRLPTDRSGTRWR